MKKNKNNSENHALTKLEHRQRDRSYKKEANSKTETQKNCNEKTEITRVTQEQFQQ